MLKTIRIGGYYEHIAAIKHDHRYKYEMAKNDKVEFSPAYIPLKGFATVLRSGAIFMNNRVNKKVLFKVGKVFGRIIPFSKEWVKEINKFPKKHLLGNLLNPEQLKSNKKADIIELYRAECICKNFNKHYTQNSIVHWRKDLHFQYQMKAVVSENAAKVINGQPCARLMGTVGLGIFNPVEDPTMVMNVDYYQIEPHINIQL